MIQKNTVKTIEKYPLFQQHHIGLYVYDPSTQKSIVSHNADKYFTPASNTKILTFYTALKSLPDTLTSLEYFSKGDSIIIWGTGEPTLLHSSWEYAQTQHVLDSLTEGKQILLAKRPYEEDNLGAGWAWDDYTYYFSAERSALPIAGNVVNVSMNDDQLDVYPSSFNHQFSADSQGARLDRTWDKNTFAYNPEKLTQRKREIPFHWSYESAQELLENALSDSIQLIEFDSAFREFKQGEILSVDRDSVLRKMMWESDNFLAEQLLIHSAHEKLGVLSSEKMIQYVSDSLFNFLPSPVRWTDGSGLSRYNLNTPENFVGILSDLYKDFDQDYLFQFFPIGGVRGTLKNYYKSEKPFVYAKTGTLSNNHCLSGYLITAKGKVLVFSFMHNNYLYSSTEIKGGINEVLNYLRENY
ncbi:D-alanyl-D-alanine carboxypeptidase/D-alanyl-D-alanine-endopeptidase (penicillin-binding protein 4) [Sediminitomix flava]|uniref:D-alanyl-D-alanine carboxypeptidase/D-alanyl-D-alanine-endopeptidase (Penicillin-binding protein 4) n=2 Tax=Sediminitomix flava TaxID=379075 RepID=A0A315ZY49_SEDFL|nr:D-alanyl-D-alanine carboxypeptidase/D-alanyl-D-alanine-endopeptidase (penicillin-binding protein 4) [Sediminitomix flava]